MEEWREIKGKGNNNYSVSNLGNVRNNKTGRILKNSIHPSGYIQIDLSYDRHIKVHKLVANAFIDNPENKPCIDHIDRNRSNNNVNNLRWVTYQENARNRKKMSNSLSKYKGIWLENRWRTRITIDGKGINLGSYKTEEEAAKAYNDYIIKNNLQEYYILNEIN